MEPEFIVETTEERMKLIRECISYKDPIGVKKLILEDKFNVESEHWELISILGDCINDDNIKVCPGFVSVCERCMNYVLKVGNPKELLLALLEQADGFNDSTKFSTFLGLIEKVILKIESNQLYSLELALETLSDCVSKLELPKTLDLEGEERRAHDMDPLVEKINGDVQAYINFLSVFVRKFTEAEQKESGWIKKQKNVLVKYLLKVLEHPLVYLFLQAKEVNGHIVKSGAVQSVECLMGLLTTLYPKIAELIDDCLQHNQRLSRRKRMKLDESEDSENYAEPVAMLALSCLSYLLHVEGYGQHILPCLFIKQGIMESNLQFVLTLMKKEESEVRLKGVQLFQCLLQDLGEDTVLTYEDLDRPEYFRILDSLFDIMIRCPVRDIREQCVRIVPGFIKLFCPEARYQISLKLFGTLKHAGAFGYCVQLFKTQMEEIIADPLAGSKSADIFCGINLKRIFLLMTSLPEGPATDLVESSDRIIAVLNFMRYLIIKDPPQTNMTGFWDFFAHIEKEFLKPLQLGLDMSMGHYKLEISGLEVGNVSKESSEEQVETSVSVAGFNLPKMARGQKIAIMNQALNTLDLITSLLVRVNELVEQQQQAEIRSHLRGVTCRMMSQESTANGNGSADRPTENSKDTEYEVHQRILKSSLPFVLTEGWTQNALAAGAEAEGLPGVAHGLFPRGGIELVYYFYTDCNKKLAEQLAEQVKQEKDETEQNKSGPKIRPFIRGAVETRLRMITPYIEKWPQAMAMMALPQNAPDALSNLLKLTDEIWFHAGDTSTDFNWYTKRATLAGVYKTTEVFMVQDNSVDYAETWQFLDRRMDDLGNIGNVARSGKQTGSVLSEACKGVFIMARNVIGANSRAK